MTHTIAILSTVVLCACSGSVNPTDSGTDRATDDVREAVFRYQFDTNRSALGSDADFYFLAYGDDGDPPPAFMARFANHVPPVEPISEAIIEPETGVRHRETGGQGLVFRITTVCWLNDMLAEVQGGYYEGNLSASWGAYRVVRQGDRWVVSAQGLPLIS